MSIFFLGTFNDGMFNLWIVSYDNGFNSWIEKKLPRVKLKWTRIVVHEKTPPLKSYTKYANSMEVFSFEEKSSLEQAIFFICLF